VNIKKDKGAESSPCKLIKKYESSIGKSGKIKMEAKTTAWCYCIFWWRFSR
jgi:hypothetical protein